MWHQWISKPQSKRFKCALDISSYWREEIWPLIDQCFLTHYWMTRGTDASAYMHRLFNVQKSLTKPVVDNPTVCVTRQRHWKYFWSILHILKLFLDVTFLVVELRSMSWEGLAMSPVTAPALYTPQPLHICYSYQKCQLVMW